MIWLYTKNTNTSNKKISTDNKHSQLGSRYITKINI